ncbi:Cyclin-D1-binding protein 1 [Lobulomyces angularis]|nr:Cyclin-D1-binding protein 1 [Lobulomyces angularis]
MELEETITKPLKKLINDLLMNLDILDLLSESQQQTDLNLNELELRKELVSVGKVISHNVTRLSLSASNKSKETENICKELSKILTYLVSIIGGLPNSTGDFVLKDLKVATCGILFDVSSLANSLLKESIQTVDERFRSSNFLIQTGIVWESAKIFEEIPLNARDSSCKKINATIELVTDAILEVEEGLNNGGVGGDWEVDEDDVQEEEEFSEFERKIATKILILLKSSKLLMTKIIKVITNVDLSEIMLKKFSEMSIKEDGINLLRDKNNSDIFEDLSSYCQNISYKIDDSCCLLEAKFDKEELKLNLIQFWDAVGATFSVMKNESFYLEEKNWFELCESNFKKNFELVFSDLLISSVTR